MIEQRLMNTLSIATAALGTSQFEKHLAEALGAAIDYDFTTVARYSVYDKPRFLIHSHTFPSHMAELYLSRFIEVDPYVEHWRSTERPGVIWLQDLANAAKHKYERYTAEFLPEIGVKDEIGVFMPALGHDSLAFFYNNKSGYFTQADVERLQNVFALGAALYRTHIRMLLDGDGENVRESPSLGRPLRVTSSAGETIWITDEWAEQVAPETQQIYIPLTPDFATQKNRFLWTLPPPNVEVFSTTSSDFEIWGDEIGLTPRERDIVGLALKGYPSASIAEILKLSLGNIKNHKLRIYKKLDITSERELFLMYIEAMTRANDLTPVSVH